MIAAYRDNNGCVGDRDLPPVSEIRANNALADLDGILSDLAAQMKRLRALQAGYEALFSGSDWQDADTEAVRGLVAQCEHPHRLLEDVSTQ